jgi:hypothetical protein
VVNLYKQDCLEHLHYIEQPILKGPAA